MAEIIPTRIWEKRNDVVAYKWENVTESDTCRAVEVPNKADKTIQVSDDFGTSGSVAVEGSVHEDQSVFAELNDPQGNAIAITAAGIQTILENVAFIRPSVTAGTSVSVDVIIYMR